MSPLPFQQLDVFTHQPGFGNPLAVVLDAENLTEETMRRFAAWTNLSETTFLLPPTQPTADYRVRIFTPTRELPFAGHPTLGSCHAWLKAGHQPRQPNIIVQECAAGLIDIRQQDDRLAFAAPPLKKDGPLDDALLARLAHGLRLEPHQIKSHQWLVNGPQWLGLLLDSAQTVLAVQPDYAQLAGLDIGLIGPHRDKNECAFEVRAFAYADGPVEDPVTGSLNAGLAQWLLRDNLAPESYVAAQGTALGRAGRVHVEQEKDRIWIGGHSVTVIEGQVSF